MNRVQEELLGILKSVSLVCRELNLVFFAHGGTLLGAVRHSGFIPWDDDVDLAMPRADYDRFIREAQNRLPPHLFVQAIETDSRYPFPYLKVRDTLTTMVESKLANASFNQGCWIDVFPLDGVDPVVDGKPLKQRKRQLLAERGLLRYEPRRIGSFRVLLYRAKLLCLFPSRVQALHKLNTFYSANRRNTGFLTDNYGILSSAGIYREDWFAKSIEMRFEDITVPAPVGYLEFLETMYGDWQALPPAEERVGKHDCVVDLCLPYVEWRRTHPIV